MAYNDNRNIDVKLYIKRRRMKINELKKRYVLRMINSVGVVIFCGILFAISVCFLVIKRPEVSETENRTLAKFPSFSIADYFSGEYTSGIELYYNDTVPGRETFKDWIAHIRDSFGFSTEDVKIHGTINKKNTTNTENSEDKKKQTTAAVSSAGTAVTAVSGQVSETAVVTTEEEKDDVLDDPNIEGEISNNILVYQNRGIMLYCGTYENGEEYAQYVNNFKQDLGDVNVYSMVCPTPVSYYLPTKYSDLTESEEDNINHINEYLEGVTPIDAFGALGAHKDEKIFENTDHHWAPIGAYYAAEEFCKTAGVPFADISKYDKVVKEGYVGTLYGYTGDSDLKDNPEDFIYYIPKADYSTEFFTPDMSEQWEGSLIVNIDNIDPVSWYCVFIGTDDVVTHVKTKVNNGRKLCVVKDSYGNALIPFFTSSFEDIYVIDMRYFEVNAVAQMQQWGVTDLLFAMNTFSATGVNYQCLETIRTQW
ncbi:MAG: DHHW family protein [Porcipelethomonas sp.]